MRISSGLNNLTFLVWNVGGFTKNKWDDSKFRNLLNYYVSLFNRNTHNQNIKI